MNQKTAYCGSDGTFRLFDGVTYSMVKSIGALPDADNMRFDPKANLFYVGYGERALAGIDQRNADTYSRRERLRTRDGARTAFFSAERDVLYVAVPLRDGKDADIRSL